MPLSTIASVAAFPIHLPRDLRSAQGGAGSPAQRRGQTAARYALASTYGTVYSGSIETTLVKVITSDGLIGWGEAQAPVLPGVTAEIVNSLFAPLLQGYSTSPLAVRQMLYNAMRVRGHNGGFYVDALSAVDCALWDILGLQASMPVYRLLGGAVHQPVPVYISGLTGSNLAEKLDTARRHVKNGFTRFKIFLSDSTAECLDLIAALRKEFGAEISIFVDALWRLEEHSALAFANKLAALHVEWLESPLPPEDREAHVRLAMRSPIAIAAGECYRTREECLPWLQSRALHLLQPDIGRSGITEGLAIASLAATFQTPVSIHLSIALGPQIASALHAAAAMPNLRYCEINPQILEAAQSCFELNGYELTPAGFQLPNSPGLGITPKQEFINRCGL